MTDPQSQLEQEIAALRQAVDALVTFPALAEEPRRKLAEKEAELARLRGATQGSHIGQVQATRDNYIATSLVVNNFFGGQPGEDGERLLADYLDSLAEDCQRLRLHRLTGKRQSGNEQGSEADSLKLQDVYTSLTTDGAPHRRYEGRFLIGRVNRFLQRLEKLGRSRDDVVPERVLDPQIDVPTNQGPLNSFGRELRNVVVHRRGSEGEQATIDDTVEVQLSLHRPELVLEAIRAERRLVLLGEPGAGKSTALRYLALLLVERLRGAKVAIPGWPADEMPVPVVVPLGRVAAALKATSNDPYQVLLDAIGDVLEAGVRQGLRRFLTPALRAGGILLLCDGLDELPAVSADGGLPPRVIVAGALRRLARETRARIVVTSRVLPYHAPGDWKLLSGDGWALRTVQSLAFGQTMAFIRGWYGALGVSDPDLNRERAKERAALLIAELKQTERLHPLVRSPLLLTMLAILHYNTGDVPRDRTRLYEECVQLLLDRWEPERQPGMTRESLIQRLGLPSLDPLRQVLHELAYQAHVQPPGDDGRRLIGTEQLTLRMFTFFKRLGSIAEAETKVMLFLKLLDNEDSSLLQRRGDEGYAFPHLTFQEYLAACHLANHEKLIELGYGHWRSSDRERWREVLLLLMGRLHQQGKAEKEAIPWLRTLAGTKQGKTPKEGTQSRLDAVLATFSYSELTQRGAFAGSLRDIEDEVERPIREAVVPLLETPDPGITTRERIAAAQVLGELGDPRYPVDLDQWRYELARRGTSLMRNGNHYWRYVPGGHYRIGGWEEGAPEATLELPHYWMACLPITVAQFAPFVAKGYSADAERWWTPEGWKEHQKAQQPYRKVEAGRHEPNQPVTIITWYEATAFCTWLTERLGDFLPEGYVVRLPTEAEWEAAASADGNGGRRAYPWGEEEATPEQAIYAIHQLNAPAPVGCCPAGAAACGALDLAGNVWEWTCSSYKAYPQDAAVTRERFTTNDLDVPLRGGSYYGDKTYVRCGTRNWNDPYYWNFYLGFRVIVAPRLAHLS